MPATLTKPQTLLAYCQLYLLSEPSPGLRLSSDPGVDHLWLAKGPSLLWAEEDPTAFPVSGLQHPGPAVWSPCSGTNPSRLGSWFPSW